MASLLIAVIYLAFISLGLPDSLLGSAWPVMHLDFGLSVSLAGIITTIILCGTVASSLMSDALTRRFGAARVTSVSVLVSALSLTGFALAPSYIFLCIFAIPYGLSAGAIDAALNNYVALHFAARHMSWLHCFWGLGACVSPYIMSFCITRSSWRWGYGNVSAIQIVIAVLLFLSLPIWKTKDSSNAKEESAQAVSLNVFQALKIRGVSSMLLAFFFYCSIEMMTMLWSSTYLVSVRDVSPEIAAGFASLFYIGITSGRFVSGILTAKLSDKNLIRCGFAVLFIGILMLALPLKNDVVALSGLVVIGFGCAPIYPSIIHSTPENFGCENSQAIVGIQMASAYTGSAISPLIFGFISKHFTIKIFPIALFLLALVALVMSERLNKLVKK